MTEPLWEYLREGCGTCQFWKDATRNPKYPQGICRRYPPTAIVWTAERYEGPQYENSEVYTAQDSWCGEYKRRTFQ